MSKRFVSCVVDLILVAIVAELIFAGLLQVTVNSTFYNDAAAKLEEEISYYEKWTEETSDPLSLTKQAKLSLTVCSMHKEEAVC